MAYGQVTKSGKGVVPRSALVGEQTVAVRKAGAPEPEPEKVERVRETSDLMWKMSNYGLVNCQCGTKIRVPPNFKGQSIRCPHCGTVNSMSSKH
jgi:heat shock protein HtpX